MVWFSDMKEGVKRMVWFARECDKTLVCRAVVSDGGWGGHELTCRSRVDAGSAPEGG